MACNNCNDNCNEGYLGCLHYHNAECIKISEAVGDFPAGTDLQTLLESFSTAEDGVSVINAAIVGGELIIYFSNNTEVNVGNVTGADGADGADGTNGTNGTNGADGADGVGIDTIETNGDGDIIITLTDTTVINLGNVAPRVYFGNSHDNPNDATEISPLLDYDSVVVDNTTTVTPILNTVYFNTNTKEIWTWDGTSWNNPMSIGNHLEESSFGHNYNSVDSNDTSIIYSYTPNKALEDGEVYRVRFSGTVYTNVAISIIVDDGTTTQNVGIIRRIYEGDPFQDRFSVDLYITRKSLTTYATRIDGIVQGQQSTALISPSGTFFPFTRTVVTGSMDTTIPPDINIYGVSTASSPVQSDAIILETFTVEKIKF